MTDKPTRGTKDFQFTDRDRLALECMRAYSHNLNLSWDAEDMDLSQWMSFQEGAGEIAQASYRMADALIHQSTKPSSPPERVPINAL